MSYLKKKVLLEERLRKVGFMWNILDLVIKDGTLSEDPKSEDMINEQLKDIIFSARSLLQGYSELCSLKQKKSRSIKNGRNNSKKKKISKY